MSCFDIAGQSPPTPGFRIIGVCADADDFQRTSGRASGFSSEQGIGIRRQQDRRAEGDRLLEKTTAGEVIGVHGRGS